MVKLIWTDQAIRDLTDIGEYIAQNSEQYAKLTIQKIYSRTNILKSLPFAGRTVPEKSEDSLRELIEGNYRIFYEVVSNNQINILGVYHSARDLSK